PVARFVACRTLPPPSCSPFPYTTLFRSGLFGAQLHRGAVPDHAVEGFQFRYAPLLPGAELGRRRAPLPGRRARRPWAVVGGHARDRKSTRLNSSHVKTSYAVFCLKKKTS